MVIELRIVGPDDWLSWRQLRLDALATAPEAFGSTLADWQDADEQRWRQRLNGPGHNVIAILDGAPAGMASGVPARHGAVGLISMFVAPLARGRGVGDRLVETILAWARDTGAARLRLAVKSDNIPAVGLYRRHGFRFDDAAVADPGERVMTRPCGRLPASTPVPDSRRP